MLNLYNYFFTWIKWNKFTFEYGFWTASGLRPCNSEKIFIISLYRPFFYMGFSKNVARALIWEIYVNLFQLEKGGVYKRPETRTMKLSKVSYLVWFPTMGRFNSKDKQLLPWSWSSKCFSRKVRKANSYGPLAP